MRSTVSSADVKGVLDSLTWVMEMAIEDGYHIELDGINYRCSVKLRDKLNRMKLEQVTRKFSIGIQRFEKLCKERISLCQ